MEEIIQTNTITTEAAAKALHKSPEFIRAGLRQERFNFGTAVQSKTGQWSYIIIKNKFLEYIGKPNVKENTK